ncbi:MAG: ATP-binding protein [Sulfuritalea sp.]
MNSAVRSVALSSFLTRVIWIGVAPLVLLAVWLAASNVMVLQENRDREAANLARNVAAALDQNLRARINALHMLAISPLADDPRRWPELYAEAQGYQESFGSNVVFADAARQMLFSTNAPFGVKLPRLPQVKGRAAAPVALETGKPAVGDTFLGPITRETMIAIAVPALRDGKVRHLLLATHEARRFHQRLEQMALPADWSLSLLDGRGEPIARRAPPGFDSARDVDPAGRHTASLTHAAWSVVVEIPRASYRAPLLTTAALLLGAIAFATLFGVLGGSFARRRLSRQVAALVEPAANAAPPDIAEIAAAQRRLDAAAAGQKESEVRFRRLFQEAPLPLCVVDAHGVLTDRNRRFMQLFGYGDAVSAAGDELWPLAFPDPAYRDSVRESWSAAVAEARRTGSDIAPMECEASCADGVARSLLVSGITLGDGILVTFFDLSERRRAELALRDAQAAALREQKLARLAALNQMEDANVARRDAEAAAAEVRQLNAELEQRVAERTAELTAANHELDSFAYAVSHDLRAPVRAMIGFSQALKEDFGGELRADALVYLDQIEIASRKMGGLIDGLLTLSRSTRGELRHDKVDLSALALRRLAELAKSEPQRAVAWQVDPGLAVRGDASMLESMMTNLLDNAWKYSDKVPAARIRVYAENRDGRPWICVADNGAGFDMAHAERLFKPFQRLHRQDEFPGIGIGLATAQRILHRHGGEIVATAAPGQGATFCFSLPQGECKGDSQ